MGDRIKNFFSNLLHKIPPQMRMPVILGSITAIVMLFFVIDFLGISIIPKSTELIELTPTPTEVMEDEEERRGEDEEDIVIPTQSSKRPATKAPVVTTVAPSKASTPTPTHKPTNTPVPTNTPGPTNSPTPTMTPTDTPTLTPANSPTPSEEPSDE